MTQLFLPERFGQKQTKSYGKQIKFLCVAIRLERKHRNPADLEICGWRCNGRSARCSRRSSGSGRGWRHWRGNREARRERQANDARSQARHATSGPRSQSSCENRPCRSACGEAHREVDPTEEGDPCRREEVRGEKIPSRKSVAGEDKVTRHQDKEAQSDNKKPFVRPENPPARYGTPQKGAALG